MVKINLLLINIFLSIILAESNPEPPPIPTLKAISGHEHVNLYWDKAAEDAIDPYSGYADFEGYRLYRSDDGGETWGSLWDKIYNYNGKQVAWKPIVQYDYSEDQDTSHCIYYNDFDGSELCHDLVLDTTFTRGIDVSGYDPQALWMNLGDNSGISRIYHDNSVVDGKEYMYAITAYDMGLRTYEVDFIYLPQELWKDDVSNGGNANKVWDDAEEFTDSNNNGIWDNGEDFIDTERENGVYDTATCICPNDKITNTSSAQTKVECNLITCADNSIAIWYDDELWIEIQYDGIHNPNEDPIDEKRYNGIWDAAETFTDCNNNNKYDFNLNLYCADTTWSQSNPDSLEGPNGLALPSFESPLLNESFTDYNSNGTWDEGEPYIDEDGDGVWNARKNPKNIAVVIPGYFASNVQTFDDYDVRVDFSVPSLQNIGNGNIEYSVVNESEISPTLLRFEIDACLDKNAFGDLNGSYGSGCIHYADLDCAPGCLDKNAPPSLYAYEIKDSINYEPMSTKEIYLSNIFNEDSVLYLKGLPGAIFDVEENKIILPEYILNNFKLDYKSVNQSEWQANWTDWFNGFQFRFDNGPFLLDDTRNGKWADLFQIPMDLIDIDENGYYSWIFDKDCNCWVNTESNLLSKIGIEMRYATNLKEFYQRPNYSYRIIFSSSIADTAFFHVGMNSSSADLGCNHQKDSQDNNFSTLLPFKIINTTLNQEVNLWHTDKGILEGLVTYGIIDNGTCGNDCNVNGDEICIVGGICLQRTGYKDCNWQYNEVMQLQETVYTSNNLVGNDQKLFDLKIHIDEDEYAAHVGAGYEVINNPWAKNIVYQSGQLVMHEAMYYKSNQYIESSKYRPGLWVDLNGDNINDNPWEIQYPWNEGDYIDIHPYKWFVDGDSWIMDLSVWGRTKDLSENDLDEISVVPNPYFIESNYNESKGEHLLHFTRLPNECTIKIYTVSGELIDKIDYNGQYRGDTFWDLKNNSGNLIAPGLYIYIVEASGSEHIGKFAVIR